MTNLIYKDFATRNDCRASFSSYTRHETQLQNSIDDYTTALLYVPEFEWVLKNLAITYYQAGQYRECIKTICKMKEPDELVINGLKDAKKRVGQCQ